MIGGNAEMRHALIGSQINGPQPISTPSHILQQQQASTSSKINARAQ
jgi:hypothetical protein